MHSNIIKKLEPFNFFIYILKMIFVKFTNNLFKIFIPSIVRTSLHFLLCVQCTKLGGKSIRNNKMHTHNAKSYKLLFLKFTLYVYGTCENSYMSLCEKHIGHHIWCTKINIGESWCFFQKAFTKQTFKI